MVIDRSDDEPQGITSHLLRRSRQPMPPGLHRASLRTWHLRALPLHHGFSMP